MATSSRLFNSQQYALAIHTASPDLGLALSNFVDDQRYQVWSNLGQTLSTHLHLYLSEFIQPQTWSDLAFIAVAKGPGGFTGTRLGVVTARTLAQQLGIPLFGISTLAAVAWKNWKEQKNLKEQPVYALTSNTAIAVQMPAHRGEVYGAIYSASERELNAVFPDAVMQQERWQQILEDWQTPYRLVQVEGSLGATVVELLDLAYQDWQNGLTSDWSAVLPFYGQSPV